MSDSESDHLLRIGDFSRFTTLSVRMLRHYDQVGLLVPVHVDPSSGYRFYGPNQVRTASRIRTLRDAGCGIGQIAELLPLFDRTEELRVALSAHAHSLDAAAQQIAGQRSLVQSIIDHLEEHTMPITVSEREFPALRVLALHRIIADYQSEGVLWGEFAQFLQEPGAPAMSQFGSRWGATYFDPEYRETDVDVAIWGEFAGEFEPRDGVQIIEFPAQKVAWATLIGPFEGTGAVCEAIGHWIGEKGYTMSGPMFNINVVSPAQDPNPEHWVIEINFPITR